MKASPRTRAHTNTKAAQSRLEILEQGFDRHALALAEAFDDLEEARAIEEDVIESRPRGVDHRRLPVRPPTLNLRSRVR
jgi:hypothetical protein